jgi:hypothetical protein
MSRSSGGGTPGILLRYQRCSTVAATAPPAIVTARRPAAERASSARAGGVEACLLIRLAIQNHRRFGGAIGEGAHAPALWRSWDVGWALERLVNREFRMKWSPPKGCLSRKYRRRLGSPMLRRSSRAGGKRQFNGSGARTTELRTRPCTQVALVNADAIPTLMIVPELRATPHKAR